MPSNASLSISKGGAYAYRELVKKRQRNVRLGTARLHELFCYQHIHSSSHRSHRLCVWRQTSKSQAPSSLHQYRSCCSGFPLCELCSKFCCNLGHEVVGVVFLAQLCKVFCAIQRGHPYRAYVCLNGCCEDLLHVSTESVALAPSIRASFCCLDRFPFLGL